MSSSTIPAVAPVTFMMKDKLRAEAAIEPSPVATGPSSDVSVCTSSMGTTIFSRRVESLEFAPLRSVR